MLLKEVLVKRIWMLVFALPLLATTAWADTLEQVPAATIVAGGQVTCATLYDKTVRCAGVNVIGELGDGPFQNALTPVAIKGLSDVSRLYMGDTDVCAVHSDNSGTCFTHDVSTFGQITALTLGTNHVCALLVDATVECMGSNDHGQLGDGTNKDSTTPVAVKGLTNVVGIAAGTTSTCALIKDGTVQCFGWNQYGQLGNGGTTDSSIPVAVSGLAGVTAIVSGEYHVCALLADGSVKCFGHNTQGQVGNGTTTDSSTPVVVAGLSGVKKLIAGDYHSCALLSDETVKCFGGNWHGQSGDGIGKQSAPLPINVNGASGVADIAAGWCHTCILLKDGSVQCVGANEYGEIGNNTSGPDVLTLANSIGYGPCSASSTSLACKSQTTTSTSGTGSTDTSTSGGSADTSQGTSSSGSGSTGGGCSLIR